MYEEETLVADESAESQTTYFHMVIGDVDAKVKIVAIGCPSEAVNIFCSRRGGGHQPWDQNTESQAHALLSQMRRYFPVDEYKFIPLIAHNCAALKIHRTTPNYPNRDNKKVPSPDSMDIFLTVRLALEEAASYAQQGRHTSNDRATRGASSQRMDDNELRSEIARIIVSASQLDAKINNIVRLMGRH